MYDFEIFKFEVNLTCQISLASRLTAENFLYEICLQHIIHPNQRIFQGTVESCLPRNAIPLAFVDLAWLDNLMKIKDFVKKNFNFGAKKQNFNAILTDFGINFLKMEL